ncbi:MAG: cobalamin biosynthesis protein P47K [Verrucomicrobiales bacterium]|nr:cobalamin biosynthesis protein P47K [Verrucomicrobiales bacterium]
MSVPNDSGPSTIPVRSKARYIMIGGFLGAGKTTAVGKLARHLTDLGNRVGLITNDQGRNLVDTAMLRSQGFATEEIPGGCFCCRFNSLVEAADRLAEEARPDVFIAEPVGSCTDLAATVTYPLRRMYGGDFSVAPISVLVDPIRAARVFGLEKGGSFTEKVLYIYRKQIEEADLVVLSKGDLLDASREAALRAAILAAYPGKEILTVSARQGLGLDEWFARITDAEQVASSAMDVDYLVYADGESLLGWLNATIEVSIAAGLDAETMLESLARSIQQTLATARAEVAHLKMTLSPEDQLAGEIAAMSLVRSDFVPELTLHLETPVTRGQLILNLRAEAAPEVLAAAVRSGVASLQQSFAGLQATLDHLEFFRPGKPVPTHRLADAGC